MICEYRSSDIAASDNSYGYVESLEGQRRLLTTRPASSIHLENKIGRVSIEPFRGGPLNGRSGPKPPLPGSRRMAQIGGRRNLSIRMMFPAHTLAWLLGRKPQKPDTADRYVVQRQPSSGDLHWYSTKGLALGQRGIR